MCLAELVLRRPPRYERLAKMIGETPRVVLRAQALLPPLLRHAELQSAGASSATPSDAPSRRLLHQTMYECLVVL